MGATSSSISLKLTFNQVLEVVKQLPENQQKKLIGIIKNDASKISKKEFSEKEVAFLNDLEESIDFANNYKTSGKKVPSLKEFLDEL